MASGPGEVELRFGAASGELRALLVAPQHEERAPGVLLVAVGRPEDRFPREAAARLASEGFVVLVPELPEQELSDRKLVLDLEAARVKLAACSGTEGLAALGFGRGGTLAFLLGCTTRLGAVVDVGGALAYPELSAERPIQPRELALNLEGAFLGIFPGRSASDPAHEIERLRATLSSAGKSFDIVVLPQAGEGFYDPFGPGFDERLAAQAWRRALAFLRESLAGEEECR